jgi:hypothetical protein
LRTQGFVDKEWPGAIFVWKIVFLLSGVPCPTGRRGLGDWGPPSIQAQPCPWGKWRKLKEDWPARERRAKVNHK